MTLHRGRKKVPEWGLVHPDESMHDRGASVSPRYTLFSERTLEQSSSLFSSFAAQPSCERSSNFEYNMKGEAKMSHPLKQKVALVTGGSRGIGAAIAKRLAADGASVAITYSKGADAAAAVVGEIEQSGGKALAIQADAADAEAVKDAVEKTVAAFGGIDVLVNNAGIAIPKKFEETTLEEIDRMFAINVRGTMAASQAALKHMKTGGRIIMVGSCVGERVLTPGLVAYSATKGAMKMFTQGLTREVGGRGITVNNVQPGPIDTDLNPAAGDWAVPQKAVTALDRYGHVDEVAALVAFVAGPESSYITGANLTVDGGTNA
jgi:3-oxoacyl-[acyl-carrier protein] reductase